MRVHIHAARKGSRVRRNVAAAGLGTVGLLLVGQAVTIGVAGPANADPAGNNATVKVAGLDDIDTRPDNEPHLPCTFTIQWYGFDQGADVVSTVDFELQEPTGPADHTMTVAGPHEVFVGGDEAKGGEIDGEEIYSLSFTGEPHAQQGYHVKLTINTPRSHGSTKKSKVYWVGPCAPGGDETPGGGDETPGGGDETPGGGDETPGEETPTTPPADDTTNPAPVTEPTVLPTESSVAQPTQGATVLGTETSRPESTNPDQALPTAVDAGQAGASTSSDGSFLGLAAGLVLLLAAAVVAFAGRTRGVHQH